MDCSRTAHTILSGLGKKVASLTTLTRAEERQGDAPHSLNDQLITRKVYFGAITTSNLPAISSMSIYGACCWSTQQCALTLPPRERPTEQEFHIRNP
ncbi:hypothetical protein SCLCIDRAFT_625412 [Scleroderma citrinum Foug A]|uniref:Uncharacterized protein n=1 Tax=Scleroderma citrinum Foug A TaxID=1036808 RepID=A0A0C3D5A4_9AGAM|nr:hypothetical protein SCLCIDRAFT_625412 [Scleroderma citrinum Foug A]